jgi:hypothetical protein
LGCLFPIYYGKTNQPTNQLWYGVLRGSKCRCTGGVACHVGIRMVFGMAPCASAHPQCHLSYPRKQYVDN